MSGTQKTEGVRRIWDKYKFVALVALAGIVLLLWPSGREETAERASPQAVSAVQAELQEEMEDILGRIQGVGEVRVLLTVDSETQEPLDEEEIAEKRARIDDMLAQLRAAEDPIALFDQLMNEYSEDGRDADGNLGYPDGYTTVKGQMVAEFENAALALKDGEISDVVESEFGYHIILRLPLDPADYRESMVAGLMEERASQWMADNPLETRESYEQIDPVQYQDRVTALRNAIAEALNAAEEDEAKEGAGSAASSQS